jgi:hypothetical protein
MRLCKFSLVISVNPTACKSAQVYFIRGNDYFQPGDYASTIVDKSQCNQIESKDEWAA